mmetsp:Transcript_112800/g.221158  ORF Transcript_112800/g.221158 Transcript_112800/m.221158 type:complete len:353 (+) Transcript_112800:165-1223(+)
MEAGFERSEESRREASLERRGLLDNGSSAAPSAASYRATASAEAGREAGRGDTGATHEPGNAADFQMRSISSRERRRSGGGGSEDRRQFQATRQEVVRNAVMNTRGVSVFVVLLGFVLILLPTCLVVFIEVWSWVVLISYGNRPCDQDLAFWLLMRNMISVLAPRMPSPGELDEQLAERQRIAARWAAVIACGWLVVGFAWTRLCRTCQQSNPELYDWVRFLTVFGLVLNFLTIFFPLLILLAARAYHGLVSRGWIKSPNAANDRAIDQMREVKFDPEVFSPDAVVVDGRAPPPSECCCCMDEFSACHGIVCTPCDHYFHRECLKEWLALSKTCPLCRSNLDIDDPNGAHEV